MMRWSLSRWAVLLIAMPFGPMQAAPAALDTGTLPMLTSNRSHIVDSMGNPVVLKGCNLGNWLMLESWMLGGCIQAGKQNYHDQAQLFRVLQNRFGEDRFCQLMDLYRDGYVGPRDFDLIKS